jgi:hypothetical protein
MDWIDSRRCTRVTGVPVSSPTSKLSSSENRIGWVNSKVRRATLQYDF